LKNINLLGIKPLKDAGITRILFQSGKTVDKAALEESKKMGFETAVACPFMIVGSGFHKIHVFFAGLGA